MLKKVLKISFFLVGLVLLVGISILPVITLKWPWWAGLTVFIGLLGLITAGVFVKRYLLRRREKKFVRRVVELDDAAINAAPLHERQQLQDLQEHWKTSVEMLRDSYLRKRGNPLYVLPWYLIIGESGTGKTSAINNARLSSPMAEIGRKKGLTSTRNCDWWFFQEAIILDSAGRYAIPIDEARDREEWEKFLTLLAQYRRKEPLNGLMVTVSADVLYAGDLPKLREDGQNIRKRIDQLMRVVGAKFPVYILVTKMDLIYGFVEFFDALPENETSQAMGYMNRGVIPYWQEVLEKAWTELSQRLRDLRLTLSARSAAKSPAVFIFPSEFDKLKPGLRTFAQAVFEENPYQETPLFRGLYFSSATHQEGVPQAEYLSITDRDPKTESESREIKDRGLFLIDFFKNILPRDRTLFRPILEFLRWRRLTNSTALMAWLLICLSICGFLTISFVHNRIAIGKFQEQYARVPVLGADMAQNVITLEKLRLEIIDIEKANNLWIIPRLGLTASIQIEEEMKARYVKLFKDGVGLPFDQAFAKRLASVGKGTAEDDLADYAAYCVARIQIIQAYLATGKPPGYSEIFAKSSADIFLRIQPGASPEIADLYDDLYYASLAWGKDKHNPQTALKILQSALVDINHKTVDLRWLVRKWIPDATPVAIKDFWGEPEGTGYNAQAAVPGAYTLKGYKKIESFMASMESVLQDKNLLSPKKKDFWPWYGQQYAKHWAFFVRDFEDGTRTLQTMSSQRNMAMQMTMERNPFFRLLERTTEETSWMADDQIPPWLSLFREINEIKKLVKSESQREKGSLLEKISGEAEQLSQKIRADVDRKNLETLKKRLAAAKVWQEYTTALDKISPVATSREVGFRMATDYFTLPSDTTKQSTAAIYAAYSEYLKLKGLIQMKGDMTEAWNVVLGPLAYLLDFCIKETAFHLKQEWDNQVLGSLQGASKDKMSVLLFDPQAGLVWKYINGPAKPFLVKGKAGYIPRRASIRTGHEQFVPFTQDFLQFLNAGEAGIVNYQPEYLVQMETLPIAVNNDAALDPHANVVSLQCAEGQVQLKNFNYPQKATFRWTPDKCTDTTLQILFPDLILTKTYKGRFGFAHFLSDFKYGNRSFTADDFPEAKDRLKRIGVSSIKVSYKINGSKPVIQLLKKLPVQVPQEIVVCDNI